ncbi:hypothetical protein [Enterovibrio nigricans]|uniref:Uncharacterized protein n=1 Tax=Enterovibrio nigricans DSM 22720 TaxID=1121868 RepID=A0A1T4V6S7_9GAMM|nr:hypothetical protein [Enterovibrio nigricans]PKF49862.1 hypothetical protein AT251_15540 [Enterovibrio nigricans]SKA60241.1 hypothetical protein SAMN02745132_03258 [Enterovibrio nigricans DSM 22720]
MKDNKFDSPDDISSVELSIYAASGNTQPVIYANGKNQLAIDIKAKATKENDEGDEVVLHFSDDDWRHIVNLRFADSDKKLNWGGSSGWCFTNIKNDYAREVMTEESQRSDVDIVENDGSVIIGMYLYTDDVNTKRIAVSIDTDNNKHFTTADNATGAEKMSIPVKAVEPIRYDMAENLKGFVA